MRSFLLVLHMPAYMRLQQKRIARVARTCSAAASPLACCGRAGLSKALTRQPVPPRRSRCGRSLRAPSGMWLARRLIHQFLLRQRCRSGRLLSRPRSLTCDRHRCTTQARVLTHSLDARIRSGSQYRQSARDYSSAPQSPCSGLSWASAHVRCWDSWCRGSQVLSFGSEGVELLLESIQKDDIIFIAFCPTVRLLTLRRLVSEGTTLHIKVNGGAMEHCREFTIPCRKRLFYTVRPCRNVVSPNHLGSISAAHYMPGSDFVYVGDEAGNVQVVNFTKPLSVATYKVALADTGGYYPLLCW